MKELFGTLEELIVYAQQMSGRLLFRGQSSARYELLPSVGRGHKRYKPTKSIERNLFDQFRLKSRAFRIDKTNKLESLVLARHYGLRTRLLDWTSNLYTALYFALEEREETDSFPISIYIAKNPPIVPFFSMPQDPFSVKSTLFFEPPYIDQRISNQNAFMSIHSSPLVPFSPNYIDRFSIFPYPQTVESIRQILLNIGIRHSTIRPGLNELCRDINDNPSSFEPQLLFKPEQGQWKKIPDAWIGKTVATIKKLLIEERRFLMFLDCHHDRSVVGIPLEIGKFIFGRLFGYSQDPHEVWLHYTKKNKVKRHAIDDSFLKSIRIPKEVIDAFFPNRDIVAIRKLRK